MEHFTPEAIQRLPLVIDETHMGRRASGIERITADLFSQEALPEFDIRPVRAPGNRPAMMFAQMLRNPVAAFRRRDEPWIFPGYPPSPAFMFARERSVLYVHDLFLLTRRGDLNWPAKLYMVEPFRLALQRMRYFLVNSETTGAELEGYVSSDAVILPYRPHVRNVFGLHPSPSSDDASRPVTLGAIGTVEPRKNFLAAARLREALQARLGRPVELHIVGRRGWGDDYDRLSREPGVRLHGFLSDDQIRDVFGSLDLFFCTSHAEGLGLPLLESQYAGLPVVAPDKPVFREVLGRSGIYIDPGDSSSAAVIVEAALDGRKRKRNAADALANVERWNTQAASDRERVVLLVQKLARDSASARRR